ncbi:putative 2-aminoethylphosphonate ABC transporter permease subunit [Aquirhabdus parva]|uniref:Putative 2-aminoethylphosphonate ABC transporter permease subunit n=1 Tax=Aquirhabdus parva TaxID=2283318 RepID=A0A345P2J6_9GAMM|nr:putative 2-aminoethylphosphonate ABC transporter permease subunit [Aquirhabdus parva]AXI01505.1 putative 2-aminoethylphosphonate ABC transporter permease subunit [Aquirhabdus parva]
MLNNSVAHPASPLQLKRHFGLSSGGLVLIFQGIVLLFLIICPVFLMVYKSFFDSNDQFVGLANYVSFFSNPVLTGSIFNSLAIALTATSMTLILASVYAYAITCSHMPFKRLFKVIALLPILAPSLLPAIALVYLFGHQGIFKAVLGSHEIYGPIGILMGYCFWLFPAALMIMTSAFRGLDARLFEASRSLGAGTFRTYFHVMIPALRVGLISTVLVAFTSVMTDFGIPKVIGGSFNMMALDVYKQIIGQQNFSMGAVVSLVLLIPALLSFTVDRLQRKSQARLQNQEIRPYQGKKKTLPTALLFIFCFAIAAFLIAVTATAVLASFVQYWPYNLTLGLSHYSFEMVDGGWHSYLNSLIMAGSVAIIGTVFIFIAAFTSQRLKGFEFIKGLIQGFALLPMAIPGLVLGLSYIFFFNNPHNPLHFLYGTMYILVISTIVHYYTVPHLTAVAAIKQIPAQLDNAARSLGISVPKTLWRVYIPVCLPAILDISVYLFVTAMTTVSAAIFLYTPDTSLASVAILNMDDAGDTAAAAAMGVLILATSTTVKVVHWLLTRTLLRKTQSWRQMDG